MKRDCRLVREKINRVSAGGRENVLVREGRCSGSFIHAPDCGEGGEKRGED